MQKILKKPKDLFAGLLFLIFGIGMMLISSRYQFGTPVRMGPGFFPVILGGVLALLGALIAIRGFVGGIEAGDLPTLEGLRAAFLILLGTLMFGLSIRAVGMFPAIVIMVLLGTLALRNYGWRAAIITALVLAAGSTVIFVNLLGQPIPVLGSLFTL
jgi:putative tricarboxylic transport membrane protein